MAETRKLELVLRVCKLLNLISWTDNDTFALRLFKDCLTMLMLSPTWLSCFADSYFQIRGYQDNLPILMRSLVVTSVYVTMIYFLLCFFANRTNILILIKDFKTLDGFGKPLDIEKTERQINLIGNCFYIYGTIAITYLIFSPFISYRKCIEKRTQAVNLAYTPCGIFSSMWFPFKFDSFPMYEIVFAHSAFVVYYFMLFIFSMFLLQLGVVFYVIAHIRNLKRYLHMIDFSKYGEKSLRKYIQYHIAIIHYVDMINKSFRSFTFLFVFFMSIILSLIIFSIEIEDEFEIKVSLVLHLLGWVNELFILCYIGDLLSQESVSIGDTIYGIDWMDCPVPLQKQFCLMIIRSQKPLCLLTGPIGMLSLAKFASVISSAYSYMTLLSNFI